MTRIELLSPAKDLECGRAAIDCGADAVYIGGPAFGAREQAANELADIAALAEYAHTYWAKVYVTLNTLLRDDELEQARSMAQELHAIGIDGLIIQDVGLLELDLPPIPIIASTQMHNYTPERVAFLEQVGFTRAILARELSLEEIAAIHAKTKMELECFIHGALCVSYSGRCYLSYAAGGRSGNRGQCAQPCRKLYAMRDGKGYISERDKHALSIRDLNLTDHLRDLLHAGVTSLKIEGRLKDRAYIMNVVSHYRAQLDTILAEERKRKSSSGTSEIDFNPDPVKTFNRGFTNFFVNGRTAAIGSPDSPKMTGEFIGVVRAITATGFVLEEEYPLHPGDGICFFDRAGLLRGSPVNAVNGRRVSVENPEGLAPGLRIHRNHDHKFLSALAASQPTRKIGVMLVVRETEKGVALNVLDEDRVEAEFSLPFEKSIAEKPENAVETARKQLMKMGDTPFTCTEITFRWSAPLFLPVASLNALRRGALEALILARAARRPASVGGAVKNDAPFPETRLSFEDNVLNTRAEAFYRRHGVKSIEPAAESGLDLHGRKVMTTRYCLRYEMGACPRQENPRAINEPLAIRDDDGNILALRFDCAKCEMHVYLESVGRRKR